MENLVEEPEVKKSEAPITDENEIPPVNESMSEGEKEFVDFLNDLNVITLNTAKALNQVVFRNGPEKPTEEYIKKSDEAVFTLKTAILALRAAYAGMLKRSEESSLAALSNTVIDEVLSTLEVE